MSSLHRYVGSFCLGGDSRRLRGHGQRGDSMSCSRGLARRCGAAGESRLPRLKNQSTSIRQRRRRTRRGRRLRRRGRLPEAARREARTQQRRCRPCYSSPRARRLVYRATNARSCHTLSRVRGGTILPVPIVGRRCRRNAMARGVVPRPQSTERTTTVCIPHGRNRCVHVPACTRTSYGSSVTTRHRHRREAAAALRVREYARVCAYSGWSRGRGGWPGGRRKRVERRRG